MMHTIHICKTTGATLAFANQGIPCQNPSSVIAAPENTFYGGRCQGIGGIVYDIISNDANLAFDYYVLEVEGTSETNPTEPRCNYGGVNVDKCPVDPGTKPQEICGPAVSIPPPGIDKKKNKGSLELTYIFSSGKYASLKSRILEYLKTTNPYELYNKAKLSTIDSLFVAGEMDEHDYNLLKNVYLANKNVIDYDRLKDLSEQEFNSLSAFSGMYLERIGQKQYISHITSKNLELKQDLITPINNEIGLPFDVYPNPIFSTDLQFTIHTPKEIEPSLIKMYNSVGGLVYQGKLSNSTENLDLSTIDLKAGMYSIVLDYNGLIGTNNLLIVR